MHGKKIAPLAREKKKSEKKAGIPSWASGPAGDPRRAPRILKDAQGSQHPSILSETG